MWVGIAVRSPPFDLFDIPGTYHETSPDPLVLGPEPELADDVRRERERPEFRDFLRTDLGEESYGSIRNRVCRTVTSRMDSGL